ncbi:TRAP transporter small permease subunit [Aestuariibacter sp. AA17]|uniref:TRAP transporter small permease protein n=1 Tax=Fluctibacter corallii TaxID=2984329 RepID=A0ABT3A4Q6_9ALTE|nr:TRAP transporter small permease subunit [Aestuariibacter sp. AA17]MCV2883625.1 TRAP transporter small permease subunit [Aestuariibacter sp. AA17]
MSKTFLQSLQVGIDRANDTLSRIVSWFTLLMVLITCLIVILRYVFNMGWIAMQESVMYLHAAVFMLGAAHTLRVNEHVRVDVIYRTLSPQKQALIDLGGSLFLLLPVNLFIFAMSVEYVVNSWQLLEGSPEAGGLPFVFILKSLLLMFAFTMTLQGIAEIIRQSLTLIREE